MIKNVGIQGIPPSVFYSDGHKSLMENCVRYCFFKKDENLQKGAEILKKWTSEWYTTIKSSNKLFQCVTVFFMS